MFQHVFSPSPCLFSQTCSLWSSDCFLANPWTRRAQHRCLRLINLAEKSSSHLHSPFLLGLQPIRICTGHHVAPWIWFLSETSYVHRASFNVTEHAIAFACLSRASFHQLPEAFLPCGGEQLATVTCAAALGICGTSNKFLARSITSIESRAS